jgi:hypothetical protein
VVRCKINFCVLNFFFILGLSGAPRPWKLKILIWRSKIEVALYIDMVLFLVANCLLIPKMYKFSCLEVNFKCYRLKLIKIWRNLKISYILTLFDLQWLKLTFKHQNLYIFGISEQFEIRKSTISIYRATSIFDLHMRIFNLQGLGAPDKPKKKIKYAEIDFILFFFATKINLWNEKIATHATKNKK